MEMLYNFKSVGDRPFFDPNVNTDNIRLHIFLNGLAGESELAINGYDKNAAYFGLEVALETTTVYKVTISINDLNGTSVLQTIDFTVVYYDITTIDKKFEDQDGYEGYQMNSGEIAIQNFGGGFFKSNRSIILEPLPYD